MEYHPQLRFRCITLTLVCLALPLCGAVGEETPLFGFHEEETEVRIQLGNTTIARYVFDAPQIPRPYFCDVKTHDGIQVTRNHPPIEGVDQTDHATYHPGLWMAFGDLSGADSWRLKCRVVQRDLSVRLGGGQSGNEAAMDVINAWLDAEGEEICREVVSYRFTLLAEGEVILGYLLSQDSTFGSPVRDFAFGDQEEMGWGIRMATPLSVKEGGVLLNSDGLRNEEAVWGKTAEWCDYSGMVDRRWVGVTLMPHPGNFRPSWFHARDYGLVVANPFGRNAFTEGDLSSVPVPKGEPFRYRNGLFVHSTEGPKENLPLRGFETYLALDR